MNDTTTITPEERTRYLDFSIELDCPPGIPRPNDLIEGVLERTGLKVEDFSTTPPFFGHQTWVLEPGDQKKDALFRKHKHKTFKPRIEALYYAGAIRYGTW